MRGFFQGLLALFVRRIISLAALLPLPQLLLVLILSPPRNGASAFTTDYRLGDLRLHYGPPAHDGGRSVTKYRIEWDASSSFRPTNVHYGVDEVSIVPEEQDVVLSCRGSSAPCNGRFALSWGGRTSGPINADASASDVEDAVSYLVEAHLSVPSDGGGGGGDGGGGVVPSPVRVSRSTHGFGYKWRVTFRGLAGDLGLLEADGHFLHGSGGSEGGDKSVGGGGASIRVEEVVAGSADIHPGAYTYEVQTVYVRKADGFDATPPSGNFTMAFEDLETQPIDVTASAGDVKAALEELGTVHTVNVRTDESNGRTAWIVTFTHLTDENRQGAGDLGLLQVPSSTLDDPTVTSVRVFENVKGTNPMSYKISGLRKGLTYHARVSAYNTLGYGPPSIVSMAVPRGHPDPPSTAALSIPLNSGTALEVAWTPPIHDGGDSIDGYDLEWYSRLNDLEVQKVTTSSTDGITEVQVVRTSADEEGITGFFLLSFMGQTTSSIAHNAPADGDGSVEERLKRLSTIGDVSVSRDLSWTPLANEEFVLTTGGSIVTRVGLTDLMSVFSVGDLVSIGGETHTIAAVSELTVTLSDAYSGPAATGAYLYKWAHGYEWTITFTSHVGRQPLLMATPGENWAGTNPSVDVRRTRPGLQPLSGTFQLGFKGEKTEPLPHDAAATAVKEALESLTTLGEVDVARYDNNNGHNYFVTFLTELGNQVLMTVDDSQLMGPNADARVATIQDGVAPSHHGRATVESHTITRRTIEGLENGIPYFVRVRSRNSEGLGGYALAMPSPLAPSEPPGIPIDVAVFALSDTLIRVSWKAPHYDGGSLVEKYLVQWDVDKLFVNAASAGFHEEVVVYTNDGPVYCYTIDIDPASSDVPRYARVMAHNGYKWGLPTPSTPSSVIAYKRAPGAVQNLTAFGTSSIGILLQWSPPSTQNSCGYGGDGGSSMTHYSIEYDTKSDFSSAYSLSVPPNSSSYRLGGRDITTGFESNLLEPGGTYYVRITAFNSIGAGVATVFDSSVGALADTTPSAPIIRDSEVASATSILVQWDPPELDGGSAIRKYTVEYDTSEDFSNAKSVDVPVVSEVQTVVVESPDMAVEVQAIRATVEVTNEVQSVRSAVVGTDEIQTITTTCDDVVAEVQTVTTSAVDTDEEQTIAIVAADVDEIQLVRIEGDDVPEVQTVRVTVPRMDEVQKLGIVISNINTDGDNTTSFACYGIDVGEPCQDVEDALSGTFTVSFDFDECGGGGDVANYCQEALSEYEPSLGIIACTPGLVTDPTVGGDHCVSSPVSQSFVAAEGDAGTLQKAINDLVDDDGVAFMTVPSMPHKQTAVTVTREGRIKTKGNCTLDGSGVEAICSGEYEISYSITFDAYHSSGDVPPLTIVSSDLKVDTSSAAFLTRMCPTAHFPNGCETPQGSSLDANHGSFYENSASHTSVEYMTGSQPTGMISLDYECESSVTHLLEGYNMSTSSTGLSASFDDGSFTGSMVLGQWLRFSAGDGIDHYRRIVSVDVITDTVTFDSAAPTDANYQDVEHGYYFSDWNEADGVYGVSDQCRAYRYHTTLPIDVTTSNVAVSETDWSSKVGALSVIDSTGVLVQRDLISTLSTNVGFEWRITFQKQPGSVNEMSCSTISGSNNCAVSTVQDASIISGMFRLGTTWPHEYVVESPDFHESGDIPWNCDAQSLKTALEAVLDDSDEQVFGHVDIVRAPYVPPSHHRWSGGYTWTVTFTSRGGNIPAMASNDAAIVGTNPVLAVSDEDSGIADTYQGLPDSSTFGVDDPGTARDGNQVSGAFALSWNGNSHHGPVATADIFTVQTGGAGPNRFTALSADEMKNLLTEHVFSNSTDRIVVSRSTIPSQWMGYTYSVVFRHQDVGGDVAPLVYVHGSTLQGKDATVQVDETISGTEIMGTFQLRFNGETTRPINHDATAIDMQDALNQLSSIAPSAVVVTRTAGPLLTGPADGSGGMSTQVGGYVWSVTFASNVWKDPTQPHDLSDVPGNWFGSGVSHLDTWDSGFSKAWGKNVGNVPMMSCIDSGLSTTNGAFPSDGCMVSELVRGTAPLSGQFKVCLDTLANPNGVMSVLSDSCTDFIDHNAPASAAESGGDGSSMEEKLEHLESIGDVSVTRGPVNAKNGGYTWTVEFLRDADAPCQQKDDFSALCNAPGDVPKLCHSSGSTPCDTASLLGTCSRPGSCTQLTVLDATDFVNGLRPPGSNERQLIVVKDPSYLGWEDGSVVDVTSTIKEYRLTIDGIETACIPHKATAEELRGEIQLALDSGSGGSVRVNRVRSEADAPNGYMYYVMFYDVDDISLMVPSFSASSGSCLYPFESTQEVSLIALSDGVAHSTTCNDCKDGIVQRGSFSVFEVMGENLAGVALPWNADPSDLKSHLEETIGRSVDVDRTVLDKYGTVQWMVTFTGNPGMTPPGTGDVDSLDVVQGPDTAGNQHAVVVSEVQKGSDGLSGSFDIDFSSPSGPREVVFDENANRLGKKLNEMSTIGHVHVTRECHPSCTSGGWGSVAVPPGTRGGYEWKIYFLRNPGISNGFTFPPGSGNMDPPFIDDAGLGGDVSTVETLVLVEGTQALTGSFSLRVGDEETALIPYKADSLTMEQSLHDLSSTGTVSVRVGDRAMKELPGITVDVTTDGTVASVSGGDVQKHLAPGDKFRIGGSLGGEGDGEAGGADGATMAGSAVLTAGSPVLADVVLSEKASLGVGEQVRFGGEVYTIAKNGIEVQLLAVHRISTQGDAEFYQLRASVGGVQETTACINFDATAADVENALNALSIMGEDGVLVSRTESSTGFIGDAHLYKIYFVGPNVVGDVAELLAQDCASGLPSGIDDTNSHAKVRTLIQGGGVEHQRISLSSDSGTTGAVPSFRLSISDEAASNTVSTPCLEWGADTLGLSSLLSGHFSEATLSVGTNAVTSVSTEVYDVEASGFVEGIVLVGDVVNPGGDCAGQVESIGTNGKTVRVYAPTGCNAAAGDPFSVVQDASVLEIYTGNSASVSEVTKLSMYSDSPVEATTGLYKLSVKFQGVTQSTSCLQYGASAEMLQDEIDALFDFDQSGAIDATDAGHVVVSREGDGSPSWGYGYVYSFESRGSSSSIGPSAVLGTNAPKFNIVDVGSDGGCNDAGGRTESIVTNAASTTNASPVVSMTSNSVGSLQAGNRIRISSSSNPTKSYTVERIDEAGMSVVLSENFVGSTVAGSVTVVVLEGGIPQFEVKVTRPGVDEHVYDLFFVGGYWRNVPSVAANVFGDGTCPGGPSDVMDGMNRFVGTTTVSNGGGTLGRPTYVLDRPVRDDQGGNIPMYWVPPIFTVHQDTSEVQEIIVKDTDNTAIWGSGHPSFKLSFSGGTTACLSYSSTETQLEDALNGLVQLCPGTNDQCVTVSRSQDPIRAPNGHVYSVYFDGVSMAGSDIDGPGVDGGFTADVLNSDCAPFDVAGGETVTIDTVKQGSSSQLLTSYQIPLGAAESSLTKGRWLGLEAVGLPVFRVSGTFWAVQFDDYLGNMAPMVADSGTLPSSASVAVFDDLVQGSNPDSVVVTGLSTGIPYYSRATATTEVGTSAMSQWSISIPSKVSEPLIDLAVGHALHVNEVQSISIRASHNKEVQIVKTEAVPIPEVQEVVIRSKPRSRILIDSGHFSLRFPETQVITWSSGSPVTAGSFFLGLVVADLDASIAAGTGDIVTKQIKTPCIPFDATAETLQHALETGAIENGLAPGSIDVIRSGDRSYSSNYGYSYTVRFVGDSVRGNVPRMTSDSMLSGLDSSGGSTCEAFDSPTDDASLQIWTVNESEAIGTDTPRAEVLINADTLPVEGQFELSVTYLGDTRTTQCIEWDASAQVLESALEALSNVDSVRVERFGDGSLSIGGASEVLAGFAFTFGGGSDNKLIASSSSNEGISGRIFVGDRVQFSNQLDKTKFYEVVSLVDNVLAVDEPFVGAPGECTVTRFFGYRYVIHFDGTAMHTDQSGSLGYRPTDEANFSLTQSNGCVPLMTNHNGVLMEMNDIPGMRGSVLITSRYNGGHTMPAVPSESSSLSLSTSLAFSIPSMSIGAAMVTQSLEDGENGVTYTITYDESIGDVADLVCNGDAALLALHATCGARTVMDGNIIGGSFYLGASDPIAHDGTAEDLKLAVEGLSNVGQIEVTRSLPDGQGGFTWTITFVGDTGDVLELAPSNSLTGKGASVSVHEFAKGNELGGSYVLSHGTDTTESIPFDAASASVEAALESIEHLGDIRVTTDGVVDSEGGRTYLVTFLNPDIGDVGLLQADASNLSGNGKSITVREDVKGSLAVRDALSMSYVVPRSCSVSQVTPGYCGASIDTVEIDVDTNDAFVGNTFHQRLDIDYSVQVVRATSTGGYFRLTYDGVESIPILASASADHVRYALEDLPGVTTVSVTRDRDPQRIDGICVNVASGSSVVACSSRCAPCNFSSDVGLRPNDMIQLAGEWFRVSSSYAGAEEEIDIAMVGDSLIEAVYTGSDDLSETALWSWSGGYEWRVTFHQVDCSPVLPLSSPKHNLLPSTAVVEVRVQDCDKCIYVGGLTPGEQHTVRARVQNVHGWSEYAVVQGTPKAIPSPPTEVGLDVISGSCLELRWSLPLSGRPVLSYAIEWDYHEDFRLAQDGVASCNSVRYGHCSVADTDGPLPHKLEFCNLEQETYYVRVAARNDVKVQQIDPSGKPRDNTRWSAVLHAVPADQVPDPPTGVVASAMARQALQIVFEPPERDGGQPITEYIFSFDTNNDFSGGHSVTIVASTMDVLHAFRNKLVYDLSPEEPSLVSGATYYVSVAAVNSVGIGVATRSNPVTPGGPPGAPSIGALTTQRVSASPITEASVTWMVPSAYGGGSIDGYLVEWWSAKKQPEIQAVKLQYFAPLSNTTFTLSMSPTPQLKRETAMLPWDAPADLVRRELMNLGWDESDDKSMVLDLEVSRSALSNGYVWTITYGNNPGRITNDGDQVLLVGSVAANGDVGAPTLTISTIQDGQQSLGMNEVQFLQVVGTGTLSGYYRLKFAGSQYSTYISVHATAASIKAALEQLNTVGEVSVSQNDNVDQDFIGTGGVLVHHYEITFTSNPGNVGSLVVDSDAVVSTNDDANVVVYDGDNAMDELNVRDSAAVPGEKPVLFATSELLDSSVRQYTITGLETGTEYFVAVSAWNVLHGYGKRMLPSPNSIIPPIQVPGSPTNVTVSVNTGYSDSLVINYDPPTSNGGDEILRYRVELDPTYSFDNPIVDDFECPANNKRTVWRIQTSTSEGGIINGGSFSLEVEVNGHSSVTSDIPYDAVALSWNESGIFEKLSPQFSVSNSSATVSTTPPVNIETVLFPGDRLSFSGQTSAYKYYEVGTVVGSGATLTESFVGVGGAQAMTTRHYGGRGNPSSSRIHCQINEDLCPDSIESKSGSVQNKLEDLTDLISGGVLVDRDGPFADNGFIWRVSFTPPSTGGSINLAVSANSLTTAGDVGSAHVSTTLLAEGETYLTCSGSLVAPSYGGLLKGLEYHARVSAVNSEGYSMPTNAQSAIAPMVTPSAPTGVSLDVVSATELRVLFGSPSDNGGDTITQYKIEYSESSDFSDAKSVYLDYLAGGAPFFKTISDLNTGTYYFVRVSAKNSQGFGISQASTPAALNPHQKPEPPTDVSLVVTSHTMLTVGWKAPLSDGGDEITSYRVEWDTSPTFTSSSTPPNKGYVDVNASDRSYTIELLSIEKVYFVKVGAFNSAGTGVALLASPNYATPSKQVPGAPHSLSAISGTTPGTIRASWQRPRVPHHGIPCFGSFDSPGECPTEYGGGEPASDGGEAIYEYELQVNERPDFLGSDDHRMTYPSTTHSAVVANLYPERLYYVRVLARNSIGSGRFCERGGSDICSHGESVLVKAASSN